MATVLTIHLKDTDLVIKEFTRLDMSRNDEATNINISNDENNLALNSLFDKIKENLGKNETFSITIEKEAGKAKFDNMAATYHLNTNVEILHFSQTQQ